MDFSKMLNKIMRRTERDVALVGVMLGSVAAMSKLFPVIEHYSTLHVYFYNGGWMGWENAPCTRAECHWRHFLKWYHGKPQSDTYVMSHDQGSTMFRRADVCTYEIRYGERVKKKGTAE